MTTRTGVDPSALVEEGAVVGRYARLGRGAYVRSDSTVHGVVHEYGVVERSYLGEDSSLGQGTSLTNSHVGRRVHIPAHQGMIAGAEILHRLHFLSIPDIASEPHVSLVLYRLKGGDYSLTVGCWEGTLEEFQELIEDGEWPSGAGSVRRAQYRPQLQAAHDLARARLDLWKLVDEEGEDA